MNGHVIVLLTALLMQRELLLAFLASTIIRIRRIDIGRVKTIKAITTNIGRGRGIVKANRRTFRTRPDFLIKTLRDDDLKIQTHLSRTQFYAIVDYLRPYEETILKDSRVK